MDFLKQLTSEEYPYLGFFLFPNGTIKEYGISYDKRDEDMLFAYHLDSALKALKEEGYDVTNLSERNIYLLAHKLTKNKMITYVNLNGLSNNKEGMLHVGSFLTKSEKEKLYELRAFFESIQELVINFAGNPMELSDFYQRLDQAEERNKILYLKLY